MANRLRGNVIILDSAMGNAYVLNSAAVVVDKQWAIQSIAFWSTGTDGVIRFSHEDTTDVIVVLENPNQFDATVGIYLGGVRLDELKVPTLTAGTAFIYLR